MFVQPPGLGTSQGQQGAVHGQAFAGGVPSRTDRGANIFKDEHGLLNLQSANGQMGRPLAESRVARKVVTDSTTAAYANPGFAGGQQASGLGSPSFTPVGAGMPKPSDRNLFRQNGLSDGRLASHLDQQGIDLNLSASQTEGHRASGRQGTSTPGSAGRSSVAYETLLSRRLRDVGASPTTGLKSSRFPRMKSKQFLYFDLDEVTFDKDKSGDNIRID